MPELPEVETVCKGIEHALLGETIQTIKIYRKDLRFPFPATIEKGFNDTKIIKVRRRAKYACIDCDNGQTILIHLGMSGIVKIIHSNDAYTKEKHDHLEITCKSGVRLILNDARRFGYVDTYETSLESTIKHFIHLGVEPLSNEFHGEYLLSKAKTSKSPIKTFLLNQKFIVGLGNIYVNEALFMSRIHPETIANTLSQKQCDDLCHAIKDILRQAIKSGGSSLKDYKHTDGSMGYFQFMFSVYNKENMECKNCDCNIEKTGGIKRIVQSGRSTFYCPKKQIKLKSKE